MHLDACLLGKHPEVVPAGSSLGPAGADKAVEILRLRRFLIIRIVLQINIATIVIQTTIATIIVIVVEITARIMLTIIIMHRGTFEARGLENLAPLSEGSEVPMPSETSCKAFAETVL